MGSSGMSPITQPRPTYSQGTGLCGYGLALTYLQTVITFIMLITFFFFFFAASSMYLLHWIPLNYQRITLQEN